MLRKKLFELIYDANYQTMQSLDDRVDQSEHV